MRDFTYPTIIRIAKTAFRALKQDIRMSGTENVPSSGGVLIVCNHIGYADFVYGGLGANPSGRLVRFMAKREIFDTPVAGQLMRSMHHISVDRGDGLESYRKAVSMLKSGEAVGIFPEATISRAMELKEFKSGAVRIAQEAGVPIVPIILWGTQRILPKGHERDLTRGRTISITVGEQFIPDGDATAETERLHAIMSTMLDGAIAAHPAEEQPPGSWWLPAKHGGGAPTLEEAVELDAQERRDRARARAAKRAKKRK